MEVIVGRRPKPLVLRPGDREALEALLRKGTTPVREARRARIVLLAADGLGTNDIAERVGVATATVCKWKKDYNELGFRGLSDAPRSGRPRTVDDEKVAEVVRLTLETRPKGATHWSTRELAKKTGLSQSTVSRIWRAFRLKPHRQDTFELSNDPHFVEKVHDVLGLYLNPPDNAVVFCVDEKTQIQALERTQTVIPMTPGHPRAISPKYRRHGTIDLFAALNYATGEVLSMTADEHRSEQLLEFFGIIDDSVPADLDIHVVLDNASMHKSKETMRWLEVHPRFHLHYTPTYASWLNLVESVFADLTARQPKYGVHTSVDELVACIEEWVEARNEAPKPLVWSLSADEVLSRVQRFCERLIARQQGIIPPTSDSTH